jgi:hypothetical protein
VQLAADQPFASARESAIGDHLPSGMSMVRARPRWFTNPLYRADELDALGLVPMGKARRPLSMRLWFHADHFEHRAFTEADRPK